MDAVTFAEVSAPVEEFCVMPAGNAPAVTDQTIGATQPLVFTDCEYVFPAVTLGSVVVVILQIFAMTTVYGCVDDLPFVSVT